MLKMSLEGLIKTTKEKLAAGDKAQDKASEHYAEAGRLLAQAKEQKPGGITWPAFVREHFDLSRERADELIRIGKGTITVEKTRADKAQRMGKSRAKSKAGPVPRGTGWKDTGADNPQVDQSDWTNAEIEADGGQSLATDAENRLNDLIGLAEIALRVKNINLDGISITAKTKRTVDAVINAWIKIRESIA